MKRKAKHYLNAEKWLINAALDNYNNLINESALKRMHTTYL